MLANSYPRPRVKQVTSLFQGISSERKTQAQIASGNARNEKLRKHFIKVRELTEELCSRLSDADASVQAMPDTSPAKWHLAHTTWFFEVFVLRDHFSAYDLFDSNFHYLFNSYYESEGDRLARNLRGVLTRPALPIVLGYRQYVTAAVLARFDQFSDALLDIVELGCHHEEQHQELLQTDVVFLFNSNPLLPAWFEKPQPSRVHTEKVMDIGWVNGLSGPVEIGYEGPAFAFDCETPVHTQWLAPHALANRLITNREWRHFIDSGGYRDAGLWLSDGWAWVQANAIDAPQYWMRNKDGKWSEEFSFWGKTLIIDDAPVRHVSYYEADAFARWYGARLPTEAEWEVATIGLNSNAGSYLDEAGPAVPSNAAPNGQLQQMFGALWQWTSSAFSAYPGFKAASGAVGEYNGKFMSGQFVLRGGSCATPRGHVRSSYRNFFYPHQRWQFTGVRLAKDI